MKRSSAIWISVLLIGCSGQHRSSPSGASNTVTEENASTRAARSRELFTQVSRVLMHPRCVNCHPQDDSPRQGDHLEFHNPPVVRGPSGAGVVAMRCQTCHQDRNVELARVPGAKGWRLAPTNMAWVGKTAAQICQQISDPKRNGGRTLAQVQQHLAHDELVAWGWAPGADRVPVPGTQAQLAALFQAWIDSGAMCETDEDKPQ
jgi:hypothetical protein